VVIALAALVVAAVTVDDVARVRDIDSLSVSPDGSRVAVFVRHADPVENRYRTGWFVADVDAKTLMPAGDGGDLGPKVMYTGHMPGMVAGSESRWSPDGKAFSYTLTRNGETQLWKSDVAGRQVQVTRNAADVRDFAWSADGRSLYFTVGTPREELRAREEQRARAGYRYDHDLWQPYDLLLPKTIVPLETRLATWVAPLDGQPERLATEAEERELVRVRAAKRAEVPAVPPALRAPGEEFEQCAPAPRDRLICVRQSVLRPPHLVSVDLRAASVAVVADPNSDFKDVKLEAERFEWDVPRFAWNEPGGKLEGLYPTRTFGWVIYPPEFDPSRKYPAFVDPYVATGFRPLGNEHALQAYAASGMVVLRLAIPAPIDSFKRLGPSAMRQMYSEELGFPHLSLLMASTLAGLDAIAARGFIDTTRVGIGGVSHGTFVPMFLLQKHDRIAAISISSPGWGPHSYYSGTQLSRGWMARAGYESWGPKPEGAGREFWRQIDLADHVDEIEAPILMHLAAHEAYGQLPLIRHLADAGKPYDAYIFPRETHIKWQPAHLHSILTRNLDWFRFWLQDHEDVGPGKAEQYGRWRELRALQCRNPRSLRDYCAPNRGSRPSLLAPRP
jgi:dipeptidyl aminopeptidase/acylaminoacyl peptidase